MTTFKAKKKNYIEYTNKKWHTTFLIFVIANKFYFGNKKFAHIPLDGLEKMLKN